MGVAWPNVCQFAADVINHIQHPQVRFSIITYSCKGNVILPPTSDREEIRRALERLNNTMLAGNMHIEKGLTKVHSEMQKTRSKGLSGSSLVIALMTEPIMLDSQKKKVKAEAEKIRQLGASLNVVGINIVDTLQVFEIADRSKDGFPLRQGFRHLPTIVPELVSRVCPNFTSVDNVTVCIKEPYKIVVRGHGFLYGKGNDRIICRFKLNDSKVVDESPISVGKYTLTCPGAILEQPGQQAFIELSLNKGKTFLSNNISITSTDCNAMTTTPIPETTSTSETTQTETSTTTSGEKPAGTTTSIPPLTSKPVKIYVKNKRFIFIPIGLSLLLSLLLLGCLWQLCCPPTVKKPPLVLPPGKVPRKRLAPPPPQAPVNVYPTIIICYCACRGVCLSRDSKGNIIVCNDDHSSCYQESLTCSQLGKQGRYSKFALGKALCTQDPCSPKICLGPGQEYLPIAYCSQCHPLSTRCSTCPSGMQPSLLPPAQINRRTVLSLPPP
nr:anthrax toxin receptor-like isoform X2 [Ictidomys tridecemlineatus]